MKVSGKDVAYVAELAHLELTAEESARMEVAVAQQANNALRADELRPSLPHDVAMQNAPQTDGTYFKVPKVIER